MMKHLQMNIPSEEFYKVMNDFREGGKFDDFGFMSNPDMRETLSHTYFPYSPQIARCLLRDKHVMFIGDSLIRAMYKDMVTLIQTGELCSVQDLRVSNEDSFRGDKHIDFLELEANRVFRQAREFQSNQHLIQYFFTNRAMREDLDRLCYSIEATDERPDVVVINSAIWDVSRFPANLTHRWAVEEIENLAEEINVADDYFNRISMFCRRMRVLLPPTSTVIWVLMPPSSTPELNNTSGFLAHNQLKFFEIRARLLEVNVRAAQIVREAGFDVLDLSFHFRLSNYQAFRIKDGVHFNTIATRYMSQLLLGHLSTAWDIDVRKKWLAKVVEKCQESELFTAAMDFLQDMNEMKWKNEEVQQSIREEAFEDVKPPGSEEDPDAMTLTTLHENMRVILMFFKFYESTNLTAEGHRTAFSDLPNELSRFSQEDLEEISKMMAANWQAWSAEKVQIPGILQGCRVQGNNKRVHETVGRAPLLPTPTTTTTTTIESPSENTSPGIVMRMTMNGGPPTTTTATTTARVEEAVGGEEDMDISDDEEEGEEPTTQDDDDDDDDVIFVPNVPSSSTAAAPLHVHMKRPRGFCLSSSESEEDLSSVGASAGSTPSSETNAES